MAILDYHRDRWMTALGWSQDDVPDILVLEGTWWRDRAVASRLALLTDVSEAAFPDIFTGRSGQARVAYCCAYGAARAAEVAHVLAQCGTPLIVQIGTCGALQPGLETGMVAVPPRALARDGVTPGYGGGDVIALDAAWSLQAARALTERGIAVTQGLHLTWTTLFAQSDRLCAAWTDEGIHTVDMETAAVAAVAARFGAKAVALLATWDILGDGKTFLDPVSAAAGRALASANAATWEVALDLAQAVADERDRARADDRRGAA
jgi:uridine phosphorylase